MMIAFIVIIIYFFYDNTAVKPAWSIKESTVLFKYTCITTCEHAVTGIIHWKLLNIKIDEMFLKLENITLTLTLKWTVHHKIEWSLFSFSLHISMILVNKSFKKCFIYLFTRVQTCKQEYHMNQPGSTEGVKRNKHTWAKVSLNHHNLAIGWFKK